MFENSEVQSTQHQSLGICQVVGFASDFIEPLLIQEVCEEVYSTLLKALLAPNAGDVSWRPVRASAAGALSSLLQVLLDSSLSYYHVFFLSKPIAT